MSDVSTRARGDEPEVRVPADLRKMLAADPQAKVRWDALTPIARRDFISWIDAAKQAATRTRRLERTCSMLIAGKRRPCCYSIVPLDLHQALAADPAAKTAWRRLAATPRRDFIDWIELAEDKPTRAKRIAKTCTMLEAGKRHA